MPKQAISGTEKIPELLRQFKKLLGEVNVNFCAIDATVTEAIGRATASGNPELQLQEWAKKRQYHLSFKTVPALQRPLGMYGIVFMHQAIETLYIDLDNFAKERNLYLKFDPTGSDTSPVGEDKLRRLVRKFNLVITQSDKFPEYKNETPEEAHKREMEFIGSIGKSESILMDYFRLLRNAAVHPNGKQAALEHFEGTISGELDLIEKCYRIRPSVPSSISVSDMILCSKVFQSVARCLCIMIRPSIAGEIVPYLQAKFSRYDPVRKRNAVIGALCTDYLLDHVDAERYA